MKELDLVNSLNVNAFDRKLQISYNLYTAIKNDQINIDFGDGSNSEITLNSSKEIVKVKKFI